QAEPRRGVSEGLARRQRALDPNGPGRAQGDRDDRACARPFAGRSSQAMSAPRTLRVPVLVSVVVPVYNERAVLEPLLRALDEAVSATGCAGEFVFVDDGSRDGSSAELDRLAAADSRIRVLHFSRNFGHQAALQAGLLHTCGDAIVVMDADLQDDP